MVYGNALALLAEVSDKIPSKGVYVVICLFFLGTVSLFARARCFWGMLLEFVILATGLLLIVWGIVLDPTTRAAVLAEQGWSYYAAVLGALALPIGWGIVLFRRAKGRLPQSGAAGGPDRWRGGRASR